MMVPGKQRALDDPLVVAWDAIQRGDHTIPEGVDAANVDMIMAFLASDALPTPRVRFVDHLGQHLSDLENHAHLATVDQRIGAHHIADKKSRCFQRRFEFGRNSGWRFAPTALALVLALGLAGLIVVYWSEPSRSEPPAIPAAVIAAPTMQPLLQFDFDPPMWGMPEGTSWTHMDFSLITLDPGKSFDTNAGWYTSTDGPFLIEVLSGDLEIDPRGPAVVYPGDHAQQPRPIDPGQLARLGPEDAIVFSVADSALGTNLGGDRVTALFGLTGSEDFSVPGAYTMPSDVSSWEFQAIDDMPVLPTKGAVVSIQRLELLPYDSFIFDPDANWHYLPAFDSANLPGLHIADGAVERLSPNTQMTEAFSASSLLAYVPGPHTLFNLAEKAIVIYFFVVEPYPAQATSTPS
jgi:hypothetical protein